MFRNASLAIYATVISMATLVCAVDQQIIFMKNITEDPHAILCPEHTFLFPCYANKFLKASVSINALDEQQFMLEEQSIKNLHARRLFFNELVKHLRTIITPETAGSIKEAYNNQVRCDSALRWAIRLVYHEVMKDTAMPLIDTCQIVPVIHQQIMRVSKNHLGLRLSDLGNPDLENFLMHAHEIIEPLVGHHIHVLFLENNQLTKVPNFNLPHLQELWLYHNFLTESPSFNLPELQKLDLSFNQLRYIPNFNLPNLDTLFLDHNLLHQVPTFEALAQLKNLWLCENQLTEIENFKLPLLERLWLSNNQLARIPNFDVLPALQKLFVSNNRLKEVPHFNLPNLRSLDLAFNQLGLVPNFNLPRLQKLLLTHNHLTRVPQFDYLENLEKLDYSSNEITQSC